MRDIMMARGARTLLESCTRTAPGESVVVVCDPESVAIGQCLAAGAYGIGAEPVLTVIPTRRIDGEEPPRPVAEALRSCDVFFTPVTRSITHTRAIRSAVEAGARGLVMTHWSEDMLVRGGIEADFAAIAPVCREIAARLQDGTRLRLSTPAGTDLRANIEGRRGNALTGVVEPGQFSTVPTIEANVSPLEGSAEGRIVADASVPYLGIGVLEQPVIAEVEGGFIRRIEGGRQAEQLARALESYGDPNVYNIAEVGIGLNPHARMIGLMLEDEGVLGVVHIGIGTSITLGGTIKAACHYDLLMWGSTLEVDGRPILDDGRLAPDLAARMPA